MIPDPSMCPSESNQAESPVGDRNTAQIADIERHKIVEHMIGGGRIVMRCKCGWGFGCNDLATADAAAAAHIDVREGT